VENELILLEVPGRKETVSHGGTDEADPDRWCILGGVAPELLRGLHVGSEVSKLQSTRRAQRELGRRYGMGYHGTNPTLPCFAASKPESVIESAVDGIFAIIDVRPRRW